MGAHEFLPPSGADIWGKPGGCTAWPMMSQLYPEIEPHPEAAIGTASHQIGQEMLQAIVAGKPTPEWPAFDGRTADNGLMFEEDMFDGAELYANDIVATLRQYSDDPGLQVWVEDKVYSRVIHPTQNGGTPDCQMYSPKYGVLINWDYKFGRIMHEAFEHWQSINYVQGRLEHLGIDDAADQHLTVQLRIVQPRAFHRDGPVRSWKVPASGLRGHVNQLNAGAAESTSDKATARTGEHCHHCTARHACPAAIRAGTVLFEAAMAPVPQELPPQALGVQMALVRRAREQLEYLESGYQQQVETTVRRGVDVPGWGIETTLGRQKWKYTDAQVINMGQMFGVDLDSHKPYTPKQASSRGIDESVIKAYSETPRTGIKIVPDNGNKAKQVFQR